MSTYVALYFVPNGNSNNRNNYMLHCVSQTVMVVVFKTYYNNCSFLVYNTLKNLLNCILHTNYIHVCYNLVP